MADRRKKGGRGRARCLRRVGWKKGGSFISSPRGIIYREDFRESMQRATQKRKREAKISRSLSLSVLLFSLFFLFSEIYFFLSLSVPSYFFSFLLYVPKERRKQNTKRRSRERNFARVKKREKERNFTRVKKRENKKKFC